MNEVLYDTGNAVVSLYDLYQLFEFPGESAGLGESIGGRGGGGEGGVLRITGPSPPFLNFSHFFQ